MAHSSTGHGRDRGGAGGLSPGAAGLGVVGVPPLAGLIDVLRYDSALPMSASTPIMDSMRARELR